VGQGRIEVLPRPLVRTTSLFAFLFEASTLKGASVLWNLSIQIEFGFRTLTGGSHAARNNSTYCVSDPVDCCPAQLAIRSDVGTFPRRNIRHRSDRGLDLSLARPSLDWPDGSRP
jgi:hypothetical protein